jgi:hypothetical protein
MDGGVEHLVENLPPHLATALVFSLLGALLADQLPFVVVYAFGPHRVDGGVGHIVHLAFSG